jgi:hypothetical protein
MLAGHHLRDLAGLEVRNFNLAADHVDAGLPRIDGDAELRALHHGGEVRRLDFEMLDVALFDVEQDRARLLHDRRRQPFLLLDGDADHGIRRDQDRFVAARQQRAAVTAGANGVARLQDVFLLQRCLLNATAGEPDFAGGFADYPVATIGGERAGRRREEERCREGF